MNRDIFHCSFCGRSEKEVLMLIRGPVSLICDTCVEQCVGIIVKKHPASAYGDTIIGEVGEAKRAGALEQSQYEYSVDDKK